MARINGLTFFVFLPVQLGRSKRPSWRFFFLNSMRPLKLLSVATKTIFRHHNSRYSSISGILLLPFPYSYSLLVRPWVLKPRHGVPRVPYLSTEHCSKTGSSLALQGGGVAVPQVQAHQQCANTQTVVTPKIRGAKASFKRECFVCLAQPSVRYQGDSTYLRIREEDGYVGNLVLEPAYHDRNRSSLAALSYRG